jgi:hypothetical protein
MDAEAQSTTFCCEITNALKLNIGSLLHKERIALSR